MFSPLVSNRKNEWPVVSVSRTNTGTWTRHEKYKKAKTVGEFKDLGGSLGDLKFAFCRGHVIIDGTQAVNLIKKAPIILRKLMLSSTTSTVARIIAYETQNEDVGLKLD